MKSEPTGNSEIGCLLCRFLDRPTNSTSPPSPLSIGWRGGTGGEVRAHVFPLPLPPLHRMERGNGSEVQSLLPKLVASASHPESWFWPCRSGDSAPYHGPTLR